MNRNDELLQDVQSFFSAIKKSLAQSEKDIGDAQITIEAKAYTLYGELQRERDLNDVMRNQGTDMRERLSSLFNRVMRYENMEHEQRELCETAKYANYAGEDIKVLRADDILRAIEKNGSNGNYFPYCEQ